MKILVWGMIELVERFGASNFREFGMVKEMIILEWQRFGFF